MKDGPITPVAEDPEFEHILVDGLANRGRLLATSEEPLFHEAGVWLPERGEWVVTSNRLPGPKVKVHAINVDGGCTECEQIQEQVPMANGGTADGKGGVILCSQGLGGVGGGIFHVCPQRASVTPLVEQRFNSPNDVVLHKPSGAMLFTDPTYGFEQGFRDRIEHEHEALWCAMPDPNGTPSCATADSLTKPRAADCMIVDDGFTKPNGVCLSPDGTVLYVTDSGYFDGLGGADASRPREVFAFDIVSRPPGSRPPIGLQNRRPFYRLGEGEGIPDGLKVDAAGRLYVGCGDGVHVVAPDGRRLGKLLVDGGGAQLCFGGPRGQTLLILGETRAYAVDMAVACGL